MAPLKVQPGTRQTVVVVACTQAPSCAALWRNIIFKPYFT